MQVRGDERDALYLGQPDGELVDAVGRWKTTSAGFIGWERMATMGDRPYFTPVKTMARSEVQP